MHEYIVRRNPVFAALDAARRELHALWIQENVDNRTVAPLVQTAEKRGVPVRVASKQKLSNMARDKRHQGVVLEAGPFCYEPLEQLFTLAAERHEKPFFLMLDLLHGPQNIGTLLRTAEICGVHGIILQDRRAPDITPAVVQYSAGAAEYLFVSQVTNLAQTIGILHENEVWSVGVDLDESAQQFGGVDLDLPLALIVGHEGSGLRRNIRKHCDILVKLPMRGNTESLNAAVAGSILLYAAWQARGFAGSLTTREL